MTDVQDIFVADDWSKGTAHFGSRLAFGRDGMLYMTVGERNERNRAQDTNNHAGKVLRLRDDGTVPPDNPFVGRAGFKPEIYSTAIAISGADGAPGDRRHLGDRARTARRRRAEPDPARETTAGRS